MKVGNFEITSRLDFILAKVAGYEVDLDEVLENGEPINATEALLLEIAEKIA